MSYRSRKEPICKGPASKTGVWIQPICMQIWASLANPFQVLIIYHHGYPRSSNRSTSLFVRIVEVRDCTSKSAEYLPGYMLKCGEEYCECGINLKLDTCSSAQVQIISLGMLVSNLPVLSVCSVCSPHLCGGLAVISGIQHSN